MTLRICYICRGDDVVPIPGTTKPDRIIENAGAAKIKLSVDELSEIERSIPEISGDRYDEQTMRLSFNAREKL